MKSVLFVTNQYPSNEDLTNGLNLKEFVVEVGKQYDMDVFYFNRHKYGKLVYFKGLFDYISMIYKNNYDTIHVQGGGLMSFLSIIIARLFSIKSILTLIGTDILGFKSNIKANWILKIKLLYIYLFTVISVKMSTKIVGVSERIKSLIVTLYPEKEVYVCSDGINVSQFRCAELNSQKNELQILFPAQQNRAVKRVDLFEESLKVVEEKLNVKIRKVYLENMNREEVINAFKTSQLTVMTSYYEGAPKVVKESLLCGTPVISTDVGDVKDFIEKFPGSFVVDSQAAKIAEKVCYLLTQGLSKVNPIDYFKKGQEYFSIQAMAKFYCQVY